MRAQVSEAIENLLQAGQFERAEKAAEAEVRVHPGNARAWADLGLSEAKLGKAARAIRAFEMAASLNPTDSHPWLNLALLYTSADDLDKAIPCFARGVALDPHSESGWYNYGRVLLAKGRAGEAVSSFQHALALAPDDAGARLSLVQSFLRDRQLSAAQAEVERILNTHSRSRELLLKLGQTLETEGRPAESLQVLHKALGLFPKDSDLLVQLSRTQVSLNLTEDAIRSAGEALKLAPRSLSVNLAFAEALVSAHQYERLLEFLRGVQPQFETAAELYYMLGIAHFGLNNRQSAIQAFSHAVELDPRLDLAHFMLGTTFLVTADFPRAEQHYKTAIALNSKNSLYYSYLMRVYRANGFQEGAFETARKALALNPGDVDSRLELAKWEFNQENLSQARSLLESLVADAPDFIPAHVFLARLYFRLELSQLAEDQARIISSLEQKRRK